ncbi:hypothetical protein MIC448_800013 [Microbacterium sp. C448]|nr:hypothetical protein MIC448_800013 [Microbacterium sp. C448]
MAHLARLDQARDGPHRGLNREGFRRQRHDRVVGRVQHGLQHRSVFEAAGGVDQEEVILRVQLTHPGEHLRVLVAGEVKRQPIPDVLRPPHRRLLPVNVHHQHSMSTRQRRAQLHRDSRLADAALLVCNSDHSHGDLLFAELVTVLTAVHS